MISSQWRGSERVPGEQYAPAGQSSARPQAPSELVLKTGANRPRDAGVNHVVRLRGGVIPQPRHVVVLDVVPARVEQIEDVKGREPLAIMPVADLRIESRIGGRFRAVVLDQRGFPEVACPEGAKPARLALGRQSRIDDVRGTVGNVPSDNADGRRTRLKDRLERLVSPPSVGLRLP